MELYKERILEMKLTDAEFFSLYNDELLREPLCKRDKETQNKKLQVLSELYQDRII